MLSLKDGVSWGRKGTPGLVGYGIKRGGWPPLKEPVGATGT